MKQINKYIEAYLENQRLAWSPSTRRSEAMRLQGVAGVLDGDPTHLWEHLERNRAKPYTRQTVFIRVIHMWQWLVNTSEVPGPNLYKEFRDKQARLFKHAYQPKLPSCSFNEARARIEGIEDVAIRNKAIRLLTGGLRFEEECTLEDGQVIGKGGKPRRVYPEEVDGPVFRGVYANFRAALAKVGLKPHDLRKLCATELARAGLKEADLMTVMGWSSIASAKAYIKPLEEAEMEQVFRAVQRRAG